MGARLWPVSRALAGLGATTKKGGDRQERLVLEAVHQCANWRNARKLAEVAEK